MNHIGLSSPRNSVLISLLLISVVCFLSYSNTFHVPFQLDDSYNISEKPFVRNIGAFFGPPDPEWISPGSTFIMRPVGFFTFAMNYRIHGDAVLGYHIVNILIHILNGFLVYFLVLLTFRTPFFSNSPLSRGEVTPPPSAPPLKIRGGRGSYDPGGRAGSFIALFAALLFVSHPVQTQAVTYIVQRFTSLATLFYMLSLVTYIKWRMKKQESGDRSQETEQSNPPIPPLPKGGKPRQQTLPPLRVRGGEEGLLESQESVVRSQQSASRSISIFTYYLLSFISAVLAMKTKEIAFTLPLVIALYEFLFFEGGLKKRILYLVPLLLTMLIIPLGFVGSTKSMGEIIGDVSEVTRQTDISRWDYFFTQFRVIVTYIRLLFFPVNQNLDYDYPVYHIFFDPAVILSFLFLSALFGTAVYLLYRSRLTPSPSATPLNPTRPPLKVRGGEGGVISGGGKKGASANEKNDPNGSEELAVPPLKVRGPACPVGRGEEGLSRLIAFGIFWFFITLSVESSVIPIADVIFEHRLYLPSVGFFIAVATGGLVVWKSFTKKSESEALSTPFELTPPLSAPPLKIRGGRGSYDPRGGDEGEGELSGNAHADNAGLNWSAKIAIGVFGLIVVILSGATYARNNFWTNEVKLWEDVVKKSPSKLRVRINLGQAYSKHGRFEEAEREYQIAIRLGPDDFQLHNNLGVAYKGQGRLKEAIREYQNALRFKPDDAMAYYNLGNIFREQGDFEEAIQQYSVAIRLEPDVAIIRNNLGIAFMGLGNKDAAAREFRTALDLDPGYEAARRNLEMLLRGGGR